MYISDRQHNCLMIMTFQAGLSATRCLKGTRGVPPMSSTTGTMMGSGGGRGNDNDNGHEDEENHHEFAHVLKSRPLHI